MIGIHFEEQCAIDDDYGKRRPIRLFPSRESAIDWLVSVGYEPYAEKYRFCQYHSEMHATLYDVVEDTNDV